MWPSNWLQVGFVFLVFSLRFLDSSLASPQKSCHARQAVQACASRNSAIPQQPCKSPSITRNTSPSAWDHDRFLAIRAQNASSKGHITIHDLNFFISSSAHAALLSKMWAEFHDFAVRGLAAIDPLPQIALSFGCFTLTLYLVGAYAIEALIEVLLDVWMATAPVTFALTYISFSITLYMILAVDVGPRGRRRVRG